VITSPAFDSFAVKRMSFAVVLSTVPVVTVTPLMSIGNRTICGRATYALAAWRVEMNVIAVMIAALVSVAFRTEATRTSRAGPGVA
jgi:hypothetical protein